MSMLYDMFESKLQSDYANCDGEQIRSRVNGLIIISKNSSEDLLKYLLSPEDTPLFNGLVTSAYSRLTGDSSAIHDFEYGGLGITAERKGYGQVFDGNQLHFAKLGGVALQGVIMNGNAGFGSEWSEQAGQRSYTSENALGNSRNSNEAFMYSTIADRAFTDSVNTEKAILHSRFLGTEVLKGSVNYEELAKQVAKLQYMDAMRKSAKEVIREAFPAKSREYPEGARMLPGFSHLYL